MARANRHYIPNCIWHITQRCHRRDFLLKFHKDKQNWLKWLFEAKKRFGLCILNYSITSNHIHLLVFGSKKNIISKSIQLVAGRTARDYNLRKKRKGAFWEDRYHATAVQSGLHLLRCLVYIDMNMVRTGVVTHPSDWAFCGYNEILKPSQRYTLIDFNHLISFCGYTDHDSFRESYKSLIDQEIKNKHFKRNPVWTESIACGNLEFIEKIKDLFGALARGRDVRLLSHDTYMVREDTEPYNAIFDTQKVALNLKNSQFFKEFL
ncbi:MAG: transposase [Desulfobacteraceae bacterium]|nr:transposase [Desulfobacteraceae bacterium]